MKEKAETRKIKYGVRLKFCSIFAGFIAVLLIFMNIYPITVSRNLIFSSKKSSMLGQAAVMVSSLSILDNLTKDTVNQVIELINPSTMASVIVTNASGLIIYDSGIDPSVGKYALYAEVSGALSGYEIFYSRYSSDAFTSWACMPVVNRGAVIGCVLLYEYDDDSASIITGIQSTISSISIAVGILSLAILFFSVQRLTSRILELVSAIRTVHDGAYDYRIEVRGHDELSELGSEFNNLTQRLKDTEELRRRFVSDASHELRTPLASIRLLSDSIAQSDNMEPDTMREFVTDIGEESERLQRITEKLMNLTRLDSSLDTQRTPVDIKWVAENTLHLLKPLAAQKDVTLEYRLRDGCIISATQDDMYQIIFNLVENGIKYNVPGGTVTLLAYSSEGSVYLIVEDTGIGIPEDDLPYIFTRFYRVDKARSREAGGSGLGLSIVYDTVALHGGTIEALRLDPCGTRFAVTFPLYDVEEAQND